MSADTTDPGDPDRRVVEAHRKRITPKISRRQMKKRQIPMGAKILYAALYVAAAALAYWVLTHLN